MWTAARAGLSLLAAGGICTAAVLASWGPLHARSDVVGYPLFVSFNVDNYLVAYYWILVAFPVLTVAIHVASVYPARRLGIARVPGEPLLPRRLPATDSAVTDRPHPAADGASVAIGGLALGLLTAMAAGGGLAVMLALAGAYVVIVLATASLVGRGSRRAPRLARASRINLLVAAPAGLLGLAWVSASTRTELPHHRADAHSWLSWPVATVAAAVALALAVRAVRSERGAGRSTARHVLGLAAPLLILLFAAILALPGDGGPFNLFEEGQWLTGAQLLEHGSLPYRDVILTHGPLYDALQAVAGFGMFGHSRWAVLAVRSVWVVPLAQLAVFALLLYLMPRDWPLLALAAVLMVAGSNLAAPHDRFLLWPLALIALGALLTRGTWARAAWFTGLLFVQCVLTPEAVEAIPGCAVVIVGYEVYHRHVSPGFTRTRRVAILAAGLAAGFALVLAATDSLGPFLDYYRALSVGHAIVGGLPFATNVPRALHDTFVFEALAPVVALVAWSLYFATRILRRDPPSIRDWVVSAAALLALPYYQKFLGRADLHVGESFEVAVPVIVYVLHVALRAAWGAPPFLAGARRRLGATNPLGVAAAAAVVAFVWSPLVSALDRGTHRIHPRVSLVAMRQVGYGDFREAQLTADMRQVLDENLPRTAPVYDFTNEPALAYYLLGRRPASRWYFPGEVFDPATQRKAIDDLRRVRPPVIVYDQRCCGLWGMDGIPNEIREADMSQWILQHYRPWARVDGQLLFAPAGAGAVRRPRGFGGTLERVALYEPPAPCNWGDIPNYLSERPGRAAQARAQPLGLDNSTTTLVGWAGSRDPADPVRQVVLVSGPSVVARVPVSMPRPDAARKFGVQQRSGWRAVLPNVARAAPLEAFAVLRDGRAFTLMSLSSEVAGKPAGPPFTTGVPGHPGAPPSAGVGYVERKSSPTTTVLRPPGGRPWSDYNWLELDFSRPLVSNLIRLGDDSAQQGDVNHHIDFNTQPGGPRRYLVHVGACLQWRTFGAGRLWLEPYGREPLASARLIP